MHTNNAVLGLAAAGSAGAALVHAAAAGGHSGDNTVQALFAATALAQLGWAALAMLRPNRTVVTAGVVLNAGAVLAWLVSRTVGLPFPEGLSGVEAAGAQDSLCALLGAIAVIAAVTSLLPARTWHAIPSSLATAGAVALLVVAAPAMAADHSHSATDSHEHADGEEPVISLDDPRLTDTQRANARRLIDDTTAGMAKFTNDPASAEALGYQVGGAVRNASGQSRTRAPAGSLAEAVQAIADNGGGPLHMMNRSNMSDGREFDPNAIESVMYEVTPEGDTTLVAAMYMLEPGKTMEDAPDIAGPLAAMHDHKDLHASADVPPMMHVWIVDHPCGPFADDGTDATSRGPVTTDGGDGCGHSH